MRVRARRHDRGKTLPAHAPLVGRYFAITGSLQPADISLAVARNAARHALNWHGNDTGAAAHRINGKPGQRPARLDHDQVRSIDLT